MTNRVCGEAVAIVSPRERARSDDGAVIGAWSPERAGRGSGRLGGGQRVELLRQPGGLVLQRPQGGLHGVELVGQGLLAELEAQRPAVDLPLDVGRLAVLTAGQGRE